MTEQLTPTDAEIAAARELYDIVFSREKYVTVGTFSHAIHHHNAPLHAKIAQAGFDLRAMGESVIKAKRDDAKIIRDLHTKIAQQKAALVLAQKAIEELMTFYPSTHKPNVRVDYALSAIKEVLK